MSDVPLAVENGALTTLQSNQLRDGPDVDNGSGTTIANEPGFVDTQYYGLQQTGEFAEYDVSFNYGIDASDIGLAFRWDAGGTSEQGEIEYTVNGSGPGGLLFDGIDVDPAAWFTRPDFGSTNLSGSFAANETLTIRIELVGADNFQIDMVGLYDTRYTYNFDDSTDANDQLSGPELYPDLVEQEITPATTRRQVTEAQLTSTWTDGDTSNNQYIELEIGGVTNQTTNSTSGSISVSDTNAETSVITRFGLSRYGSRTNDTPTTGFKGQAIESFELTANPDAITPSGIGIAESRAVFPSGGPLDGTTLREAGILGPSDELLTRSIFAPVEVESDMTVISSELTRFTQDG